MSKTRVFIFDELFNAIVSGDQIAKLKSTGADIHVVSRKCKITDYEPIKDPDTQKILCINPDFVDWQFLANDYETIPGLKVIISSSENIDWLDSSYADDHAISCVALENLTTEYSAVAEYALTVMMSLARNIPMLSRDGFPLNYAKDFVKYQGLDIAGKTIGIIGLGNIGGAIARLCTGLGMNVVYWSRTKKPENGYEYREIDDLLKEADVIFPTLKPNDETKLLLSNERLELIKQEAIVIGVVSELVDTDYLAERVAEKKLLGFGFGADPKTFSDYSGNVWAIPDYAWATKRNMRASYEQFVEKIVASIR
jgi:glyoxylate reductase